jgi:hypothetical protein
MPASSLCSSSPFGTSYGDVQLARNEYEVRPPIAGTSCTPPIRLDSFAKHANSTRYYIQPSSKPCRSGAAPRTAAFVSSFHPRSSAFGPFRVTRLLLLI